MDSGKKQNRSHRTLTREEYALAEKAYLNEPSAVAVARALGCGQDVAQRLLFMGAPKLGLPPLEKRRQEVARLEVVTAGRVGKSLAKVEEKTAAELARIAAEAGAAAIAVQQGVMGSAVQQLAEETKLAHANRDTALSLTRGQARLAAVAETLAMAVESKLVKAAEAATGKDGVLDADVFLQAAEMTVGQALGTIRTIANVGQRIAETSRQSVEMVHLLTGKATSIVQVQGGGPTMTKEEAMEWGQRSAEAFLRMQKRLKMEEEIAGGMKADAAATLARVREEESIAEVEENAD